MRQAAREVSQSRAVSGSQPSLVEVLRHLMLAVKAPEASSHTTIGLEPTAVNQGHQAPPRAYLLEKRFSISRGPFPLLGCGNSGPDIPKSMTLKVQSTLPMMFATDMSR